MDLTTRAGRKEQGKRIQSAAEDVGLSLEELAREIGCSRALIYQYASGAVLAQPGRLQKIAERTGRSLAYFYEEGGASAEAHTGRSQAEEAERAEPVSRDLAGGNPGAMRLDTPEPAPPPPAAPPDSRPGPDLGRSAALVLPYLEELSDVLEITCDPDRQFAACERIIPLAREVGAAETEARAWLRLGNARIQRGYHDLAVPALRVGLELFEMLDNTRLALACRQSLGRALLALGDADAAMKEFRLVAEGPSWANRWQGAISIAAVYEQYGDFAAALEWCDTALQIVETASDEPEETVEVARCYVISNQANVYLSCGDLLHARSLSHEMMRAAERSNQRDQFIESLLNLAVCQFYSGDWGLAEDNLLRATDVARFSRDRSRLGLLGAWYALLLARIGQCDDAKQTAKDSLQIGVETMCRRCEIQSHLSLGEAYLRAEAPKEALYHFDRAWKRASSGTALLQQSMALERRAVTHLALNEWEAARKDAEASLALARSRGMQHVEAIALLTLARVHATTAGYSEALELAHRALELAAVLGLVDVQQRCAALLASVLDRLGSTGEAIHHGQLAIEHLAALRSRVRGQRDDEALLNDPENLETIQAHARRLLGTGARDRALATLDSLDWPPLLDWFDGIERGSSPGEAEARV